MTMARLLRSGVKRKFHAPFCSGGRGRKAPPYRNFGGGAGLALDSCRSGMLMARHSSDTKHSADADKADSAGPFGGKPPPLFGGERSRLTIRIDAARLRRRIISVELSRLEKLYCYLGFKANTF